MLHDQILVFDKLPVSQLDASRNFIFSFIFRHHVMIPWLFLVSWRRMSLKYGLDDKHRQEDGVEEIFDWTLQPTIATWRPCLPPASLNRFSIENVTWLSCVSADDAERGYKPESTRSGEDEIYSSAQKVGLKWVLLSKMRNIFPKHLPPAFQQYRTTKLTQWLFCQRSRWILR